jgi:hypothetical protein
MNFTFFLISIKIQFKLKFQNLREKLKTEIFDKSDEIFEKWTKSCRGALPGRNHVEALSTIADPEEDDYEVRDHVTATDVCPRPLPRRFA